MLHAPFVPAIVLPRSSPLSVTATSVPACAVPEMVKFCAVVMLPGCCSVSGLMPVTTGAGGCWSVDHDLSTAMTLCSSCRRCPWRWRSRCTCRRPGRRGVVKAAEEAEDRIENPSDRSEISGESDPVVEYGLRIELDCPGTGNLSRLSDREGPVAGDVGLRRPESATVPPLRKGRPRRTARSSPRTWGCLRGNPVGALKPVSGEMSLTTGGSARAYRWSLHTGPESGVE